MTPASKLIARARRDAFASEVARPDESLRLVLAALLVAAEDEAHLGVDVDRYLLSLSELVQQARARLGAAPEGNGIEVFNEWMFDELGFKGNHSDYYDPRNSFLNCVLDRRKGIPLTLSIVYMEVGRGAGLDVEGVGLPGHFIVRVREKGQPESTLVDPFYGKILSREDCQERLDEIYGGQVALNREQLRAVTKREMLVRLLMNLKAIYTRANLYRQALAVVERLLLVQPEAVDEHRDRGVLLAQLGRLTEAIAEMQVYLNISSQAAGLDEVREQLQTLRRKQAMRN